MSAFNSAALDLLPAILGVFLLASPCPAGSHDEEVVIAARDGRRLAGTLSVPATGSAPFPAAISLTGSGLHYRDGNRTPEHPYRPFREIAGALASKGIAMLRLDDRGIGGSTGDGNAATGDDVAEDARIAIAWLRSRKEIDPARIAVIGHSFGGEIAPMVAADDPRVAALVLMGAPAVSFRETMRYQHAYDISRDASIPAERRAAVLEQRMARQERNVAASTEKWRPWSQDRDPLPTARRVRCPVLILQGLTDRAVSPDEARTLDRVMREAGNRKVTLKLFENLNHHFNHDPVGATDRYDRLPSQALATVFLDTLSSWLARTLEVHPGPGPRGR
ncbi:MAG: alpha/beta fold hydrolase [Vicinamibacteria bacterium]|nr:alpha/beta fold hydrolase [Vicinamibacteria bacterium]